MLVVALHQQNHQNITAACLDGSTAACCWGSACCRLLSSEPRKWTIRMSFHGIAVVKAARNKCGNERLETRPVGPSSENKRYNTVAKWRVPTLLPNLKLVRRVAIWDARPIPPLNTADVGIVDPHWPPNKNKTKTRMNPIPLCWQHKKRITP